MAGRRALGYGVTIVLMRLHPRKQMAFSSGFAVGTPVLLVPDGVRGVVVDIILDEEVDQFLYAIVAFDSGLAGPVIYQPIRWNLLVRVGHVFVVNAAQDAIDFGELTGIAAAPLNYGGNAATNEDEPFVPTPQSARVH